MVWAVIGLAISGFDVIMLAIVLSQLTRRPFPAALTLAVVSTLYFAINSVAVFSEGASGPVVPGVGILFLSFYWYTTIKAASFTRLAREYPDLFLSRRHRGERAAQSGKAGSVRKRSRARVKRDAKPPYVMISVIGAVVLGVMVVGLLRRPDSPEQTIDRIAEAWNEGDFDALSAYVEPGKREKWVNNLSRVGDLYDWDGDWPLADEYAYLVEEGQVNVELVTEAGVLPFRLRWDKELGAWILYAMSFREVKDWKKG